MTNPPDNSEPPANAVRCGDLVGGGTEAGKLIWINDALYAVEQAVTARVRAAKRNTRRSGAYCYAAELTKCMNMKRALSRLKQGLLGRKSHRRSASRPPTAKVSDHADNERGA
jgi:hypothetical protein